MFYIEIFHNKQAKQNKPTEIHKDKLFLSSSFFDIILKVINPKQMIIVNVNKQVKINLNGNSGFIIPSKKFLVLKSVFSYYVINTFRLLFLMM